MTLQVYNGSSFSQAAGVSVYDGSAWQQAKAAYVWDGSTWRNFLTLDKHVITVGQWYLQIFGPPTPEPIYGYYYLLSVGSIDSSTSKIYTGTNVGGVYFNGLGTNAFEFLIDTLQPNSGWSTITTDDGTNKITFKRTDATYTQNTGSVKSTVWSWSTATSPFSTATGALVTVTWQ